MRKTNYISKIILIYIILCIWMLCIFNVIRSTTKNTKYMLFRIKYITPHLHSKIYYVCVLSYN